VRVWEFSGAMSAGPRPVATGPPSEDGEQGGDPVDLSTGLFVYEKTDLEVPDVLSAAVKRTYRPQDSISYAFGIGTTSPYDVSIWGGPNVDGRDTIDFYRPDGGRVRYTRTNPGTPQTEAVYEAQGSPGRFFRSKMRWNAQNGGWDLRFRDGAVYEFGNFTPLRAIRDRFGNELRITRSNGASGRVTQLTTPNGRWVKFTYDAASRVSEARDNGGRRAAYTYNTSGRLATATDPGGGTSTYTYDGFGRMTSVADARGITFLRTTYDANGRAAEQTTADGATHRFAYTLDTAGRVERTRVTAPRGSVREVSFNAEGYSTRDVRDLGGPSEQVTTYEREAATNLLRSSIDPLGRRTP